MHPEAPEKQTDSAVHGGEVHDPARLRDAANLPYRSTSRQRDLLPGLVSSRANKSRGSRMQLPS